MARAIASGGIANLWDSMSSAPAVTEAGQDQKLFSCLSVGNFLRSGNSMPQRIFVSYAHVDDQPEAEGIDGWVTHLVRELNRRVTGILGRQGLVRFTIDHQLNGHETLDEQIRKLILESSIFLMVGSPGYLRSDWCLNRELPGFLNKDVCTDRIFIVEKMKYDRARMPGPVSSRIGRAFWEGDEIRMNGERSEIPSLMPFRIKATTVQ